MNDDTDNKDIAPTEPCQAVRPKYFKLKVLIVSILLPVLLFLSFVGSFGGVFSSVFSREWNDLYFNFKSPINIYINEHKEKYPTVASWCDDLVTTDYGLFQTNEDGSVKKELRYAANPEALALGDKAPEDMVLIFPSVKGWNLAGGPELLRIPANGRVAVLFANFQVRTYRGWQIPYLKWKASDTVAIPRDSKNTFYSYLKLVSILWAAGIAIFYYRHFNQVCLLALAPAVLGGALGYASQFWFFESFIQDGLEFEAIGFIAGGIIGLLAGVHYACYMARRIKRAGAENVMFLIEFILPGMITGIICSAITNWLLIVAYNDSAVWQIPAGLGFGAISGAFVGMMAYLSFGGKARRLNTPDA